MRALLIGQKPDRELGFTYENAPPFDAVVIGSLSLGQALVFANEQALMALAEGKQVVCYEPGFPVSSGNRALATALASAKRNMKNLGIVFTDGGQKKLITAEQARQMKLTGVKPTPGSVLTPLAKEI